MNFLSSLTDCFTIVNLLSHIIIFFGGLYIAVHSRVIPLWLSTCLWYIGSSSLLISLTIIFEYVFGDSFIFSYSNFGTIGETAFNITISTTIILLFFKTIYIDYKNKSKRSNTVTDIKI